MMTELDSYRSNVDRVNDLGRDMMAANRDFPDVVDEVSKKLESIGDTFSSLQLAAGQIKVAGDGGHLAFVDLLSY